MVSTNPESAGVTVNVAPVLDREALEELAADVEARVAAAVTAGIASALRALEGLT